MDTFDILRKFGEYINYDPNQNTFNLLSNDWELHRAGDTITTICDRFDQSGKMAVLYAKKVYLKTITDSRVKLIDVLQHLDSLAGEMEMYDLFHSPDVEALERSYIDALHQTVLNVTGMKELGERDLEHEKKVVYNALEIVLNQLGKCYKDVYVNSHLPVEAVRNISTKIQMFNYMADCVLTLQNKAPDGAYICYISNNGTADGYFAIMIKSNGNLFSVNDRVPERYIGQHTKSRNGRWTEDHKDFFPYEAIMTFSDYDYKGYASKYNVDESKLSLADLSSEVYVPLILATLCVMNDQVGKLLDDKYQVYMNTLIKSNMEQYLEAGESTALIQLDQTGLIEQTTQLLDIHLDPDKVMNGSYNQEFQIHSSGNGQKLVQYYGKDYQPKVHYLSLTARNALSDGKQDEPIHAEFVGRLDRMREQAYYEARIDLAKHVRQEHAKQLADFGGLEKVYEWFSEKMRGNMPNLYSVLTRLYMESVERDGWRRFVYRDDDPKWIRHIRLLSEKPYIREELMYNEPYRTHPSHYYPDYFLCPITGTKANIWIEFESFTDADIAMFTGCEVIPPLRGWRSVRKRDMDDIFSDGNPLLDVVDAMDFVKPLSETETGRTVEFNYCIGFSKRGMNRLMKEHGLKMGSKD